jgi:4-aminobutyrate aminotransferase/(S)-3-amino-2-methylpropionate transaminase
MEKEDYPGKALKISEKCMKRFNELKNKYEVVGDVRGLGAMMGIEFVTDRASQKPNADVNSIVRERIRTVCILKRRPYET